MSINVPDTLPDLRDYQQHCYDQRLSRSNNQILCLPTGAGKGNIIVRQLLDNIKRSESTLIIVPSEELVGNIEKRIKKHARYYLPLVNFISGTRNNRNYNSPFVVTTYQSLFRNLHKAFPFKNVIYDEVHTSSAISPLKCLKHFGSAVHTGYTATPGRLDNKPLDYIYDELVMCPLTVRELIDREYLADFDVYGVPLDGFSDAYANRDKSVDQDGLAFQQKFMSNNKISQKIWDSWQEASYGKKTIVFASGIAHAVALCELFNSHYSEKRFLFMHSGMKFKERNSALRAFEDNEILGIININMLVMGVDVADAVTAVLARATQSDNMHRQQMGRVMRVKPDGGRAIFLDFVGNITSRHGSPTFEKEYSLESDPNEKITNPLVVCPHCLIPMGNRSSFVRQILRYAESGVMASIFLDISDPKASERSSGDIVRSFKTTIKCNTCSGMFERRFDIIQNDSRRMIELKRDDSIGELSLIDYRTTDEIILNQKLNRIVESSGTSQAKRSKILQGSFDIEEKAKALKMIGERDETIGVLLS